MKVNDPNWLVHEVKKSNVDLFTYLKEDLILSMRQTNQFMKSKQLYLNDKVIKKNMALKKGDLIQIEFNDEAHDYELENIPLDIIYETDDLLIINKAPHIVVHPTQNIENHTIANAVAYYFRQIGLKRKIRFVNRIDRDTSGLLIIAKNAYAHQFLAKQFEQDDIKKIYWALVEGQLESKSVQVDAKIDTSPLKKQVSEEGKASQTNFKVLKEFSQYSLVECELKSGRTHQIRVHLSELQHPILGDTLYGNESPYINRQALHAYELTFIEPRTFMKQTVIAPIPMDMEQLIK